MELKDAMPILRSLADGIDPTTGAVMSNDSPYQSAPVIRALYLAVKLAEDATPGYCEKRLNQQTSNGGQPCSAEEDKELCQAFHAAVDFADIARAHGRTRSSIVSRLKKLGKM
jgi:hypothetical protein